MLSTLLDMLSILSDMLLLTNTQTATRMISQLAYD